MPGRQAHGRPLMAGPSSNKRSNQRSKAKANKKALDAFAIASREVGDGQKLTPRNRELDADLGGKRARQEDDEDDDEEEERPRKVRRGAQDDDEDSDVEYGSDSSGNEWKVGVDMDNDSEIDSDEAFGESDEEKFDGYAFRGSTRKKPGDEEEEEEDDDEADGASLGSDAIDLATALDQYTSDDDADGGGEEEDDDDDDEESESDSEGESSQNSSDDESEEELPETGLQDWAAQFGGDDQDKDEAETAAPTRTKINLKDLGLLGVKDPQLKKSLKLMSKEEKSSKPQKLAVPLPRRQQAALDRNAAYETTNKTLDRWTETVKQNRRADHLVFPLAQTETGLARHDNSEIVPLNRNMPGSELEQTILGIMEQSGLGAAHHDNEKQLEEDSDGQTISRKALWQQKRREREMQSREEARLKRIKKIKSKAYHRVHKKQKEREELKDHELRAEMGEIDSEEEREAQDRQRAMERMGARHRESKWAKMAKTGRRAAWDDDARMGLTEMARRDEELRRRIEGKGAQDEDDDSDFSGDSDDVDERKRLLKELNDMPEEDAGAKKSKLMNMAFMQKAEAAKKKANDELVAQIRRELASDDEDFGGSEPEAEDVGRRRFGQPGAKKEEPAEPKQKKKKAKDDMLQSTTDLAVEEGAKTAKALQSRSASAQLGQAVDGTENAWATAEPAGPPRKRKSKTTDSSATVDIDASVVAQAKPAPKPRSKNQTALNTEADDSSDDERNHFPIQFKDQQLLDKAFGGLDVVAEFEQEKREIEEEDDEKVIDNTLPGWGSWVGNGASARERKRHTGRFLTKQEGIKKKDRKDAKLKDVVINEKQVKKNNKYLASQLPHPYESVMQYERALRLPVGPEWVTKETFQEATKPRVILKQGIIVPMARPMN